MVSEGTLTLGNATDTLDGAITVSGGTLNVDNPDTVGAVTLTSGTISGDSTLTATSYTAESGTSSVALAGSGAVLTKNTADAAVLSGVSTYDGGTILNAGRLGIRNSNSPLGTGAVTINGGVIGSVVSARSLSNNLIVNNDFQLGGVNAPSLGNAATTFNGAVNLGGFNRIITLADSASFSGIISNGGLTINASAANRVLTLGGNSTYTGPTNIDTGGLIINGDNSAANGLISLTTGATIGGNGTSGAAVAMTPGCGLTARITDWTGAAGVGYDDLTVASLDAGSGALNLVLSVPGLVNFTETSKSFSIVNTSGVITGLPTSVAISTPGFPGTGTWALAPSGGGTSLVLTYTAGTEKFDSWIDTFIVADENRSGDPDNDGSSNLMEFVLNGNPGVSDPDILPDLALTTNNFTFSYVRRADSVGVPQVVQYGSDLIGWTDATIPSVSGTTGGVVVGATVSGTQTVTVTISKSVAVGGKLFARLKVGP
jgi:autotransporter-associated beta strand protein